MSLCFSTAAWGQNLDKDTIKIKSISVKTVRERKAESNIGSRTSTISNAVLQATQTQSLAELLSENSLVYIKSQGLGAMATVSLRGTSSNHTQVNWNGIPINSPMLGNFDFSQIPAFFTDEVSLYHGSSYLKGGTGALGGSINLGNNYDKQLRASEFKVMSEYGSNSTFTEGAAARFSVGKLTSSTRLYYQTSDNDFRYLNKVLNKDAFYERRKHADFSKYGIMQQLYYDLPNDALLSANIWYLLDDRNLAPPVSVYRSSKESQRSANLRSYLRYSKENANQGLNITASYLNDDQRYKRVFDISLGDLATKNISHSALIMADYRYTFGPKMEINASANYRYDQVVSDSYAQKHTSRNTVSAMVAAIWRPTSKLALNAQIMSEVNGGRCVPTYSIGGSYQVIDNLLKIKASNAYNHRYPTLNDLYWEPGGNIDLRPERGFSYDATVALTPKLGIVKFDLEASYYHKDIKDWIMWIPTTNGYIWEPANFNRVRSQGLELMIKASAKTGNFYHNVIFNYAYSPSIDRSTRGDGTRNMQLPYIPLNHWNARYLLQWLNMAFNYCISFTDVRFTSADESYSTNAYTTHDAELDYKFKLGKRASLKLSLRVDNITNAYYESTQYYPMPLRSYYTSAIITF